MRYIKQSTNTIHYIADIRRENPTVSIPDDADCSGFGYEKLVEVPTPVYNESTQRVVEGTPINNTQVWNIVDIPQEELISTTARAIEEAVQNLVDTTASNYNFNTAASARAQAGKNVPANANQRVASKMSQIVGVANALADWELEVWATVAIIKEDVMAGTRTMPTVEEVLLELPSFTV